ncbi:MAG: type II toxin-antitoxin system VapB family antitoxin [Geminicoccaceae bacterium]
MALSIRDPETDRLARELAAATGETMTQAIRVALAERLARTRRAGADERRRRIEAVKAIQEQVARLPVLDPRSPDEILGYDADGLPR